MEKFKMKYGPWALVAGASEGLGASFARSLAKRRLNLVIIARRRAPLETLAEELRRKYDVKIKCYVHDLADTDKTMTLARGMTDEIGLLVYNAAYSPISYFTDLEEDELLKITAVNIRTPLLLAKIFSEAMQRRGRGGMILMSSLSGNQGSPKIATYAASKAFSTILAEGLWSEFRGEGIDILASVAGAIKTPGYAKAQGAKDAPGTLDAETVAEKTLRALGRGPVVVPGRTNTFFHILMSRILPRKMAISLMDKNTRKLS